MMKADYPAGAAVPGLKKLWRLAFGDSEETVDAFFATGYAPDRCRCMMDGETVAAALYWLDSSCEGEALAYIYAVATHPDYRGRGLCRRLMEDTHAVLKARGYAGAVLYPADGTLRQMYGKMGYRDFSGLEEFYRTPAGTCPVKKLDSVAYGAARRAYLPEGGILQEGESLAWLGSYARFYEGEGWLLAAVEEGEGLIGLEFLGDRAAVPGILGHLGKAWGRFRAPGTDTPFGMFLPLKKDVKIPSYLGHAFD
jgi:GNAT superfamily N-acetyltransferase